MAKTYTYLALSGDVNGISGKCFDEKNQEVAVNAYTTDLKNIHDVMKLTSQYFKQS